jgi:hypothetical protein
MTARQERSLEEKLREQLQLDVDRQVDDEFEDMTRLETDRMKQHNYQPKVRCTKLLISFH